MSNDIHLLIERVNLRTLLASLIVGGLGLSFLFLSKPIEESGYHRWGSLSRESGAVLLASVALALLWDVVGRRAFADEILAKANMSRDLAESGIDVVCSSFQDKRIAWDELFKNACKLDVLMSYGHTWRNSQIERIDMMLSDPAAKIRIILPDPVDMDVVNVLSMRYRLTPEQLQREIADAKEFFEQRKSRAKGTVEIYFAHLVPLFSFYRFNNKVVFALYNHRGGRIPVPTFIADKDGFLFKYFTSEFDGIIENKENTRRADAD
jgi:hypothetical protein